MMSEGKVGINRTPCFAYIPELQKQQSPWTGLPAEGHVTSPSSLKGIPKPLQAPMPVLWPKIDSQRVNEVQLKLD